MQYLRRALCTAVGFQRSAWSGGLLDASRVADVEKWEMMVTTCMDASHSAQGDLRIASPGREGLRPLNRPVHFIRRPSLVNPHWTLAVVPVPEDVQPSLNPVQFPSEQCEPLPGPQRLEESLCFPIKRARPLPPLHQRDASLFDQTPEPGSPSLTVQAFQQAS